MLFHRATRRAIDALPARAPADAQVYFFTRSGYSGLPGLGAYENATLPGDEPTDWSRSAGLAAQAPDMLNRGDRRRVRLRHGHRRLLRRRAARRPRRSCSCAGRSGRRSRRSSACTARSGAGTHVPWTYDAETVRIYRRLSRAAHSRARPLILAPVAARRAHGLAAARPLWLAVPGRPRRGSPGPGVAARPERAGRAGRDGARALASGLLPARVLGRAGDRARRSSGPGSRRVAAPLGRLPYFFRCGTRPFAASGASASDS